MSDSYSKHKKRIKAINTKSFMVFMARWHHERHRGSSKRPKLGGRRKHYDQISWTRLYSEFGTFSRIKR